MAVLRLLQTAVINWGGGVLIEKTEGDATSLPHRIFELGAHPCVAFVVQYDGARYHVASFSHCCCRGSHVHHHNIHALTHVSQDLATREVQASRHLNGEMYHLVSVALFTDTISNL